VATVECAYSSRSFLDRARAPEGPSYGVQVPQESC